MKQIIKDFEIEDEEQEIKEWYDGYKIGKLDGIYNPWSIDAILGKYKFK